ncbi:peptidylprolyl isomerase [Paenibacillus sp. YYML68]|uniref:peptidylprolyl isomerase n=1 Tax=Paenibacillus sp. YYML68 TaxID=2909250 RepID=UPI0024900342|nr:peptidylprolyl isomerase [Paenibacillus sp. YYML68]
MWKEKLKLLTAGGVIGALLTTAVGVSAAGEQLDVYVKQLKLVFHGVERQLEEGQGKTFIHEGTTYVPLRFISESLGQPVQYNGQRETIYIGYRYHQPPEMMIDPDKSYKAKLETTKGTVTIELYAKSAPLTVNNFVFLAKEGFYEDVIFHRVLESFVIQGGDPTGTGRGGPGYSFADELNSGYRYEPGVVAMANAGPDTNGSQFFICTGEDSHSLNQYPNYSIFGRVVDGMDVVKSIAAVPVTAVGPGGEASRPVEPVAIKKVTIEESGS